MFRHWQAMGQSCEHPSGSELTLYVMDQIGWFQNKTQTQIGSTIPAKSWLHISNKTMKPLHIQWDLLYYSLEYYSLLFEYIVIVNLRRKMTW